MNFDGRENLIFNFGRLNFARRENEINHVIKLTDWGKTRGETQEGVRRRLKLNEPIE